MVAPPLLGAVRRRIRAIRASAPISRMTRMTWKEEEKRGKKRKEKERLAPEPGVSDSPSASSQPPALSRWSSQLFGEGRTPCGHTKPVIFKMGFCCPGSDLVCLALCIVTASAAYRFRTRINRSSQSRGVHGQNRSTKSAPSDICSRRLPKGCLNTTLGSQWIVPGVGGHPVKQLLQPAQLVRFSSLAHLLL